LSIEEKREVMKYIRQRRHPEQGVTLLLVVVALIALLSMAALAIDVVTLYVARAEAQRSAESAALLAAKALVDYGVTSAPGDTTLQTAAQAYAKTLAQAAAQQNKVGGAVVPSGQITVTFPNAAAPAFGINPQVRVTVQQTGLGTFFARIWPGAVSQVQASATAEAYNPSNAASLGGSPPPVAVKCVKPWLLPNMDPAAGGTTFLDPATGIITRPGRAGIIGQPMRLLTGCNPPQCSTQIVPTFDNPGGGTDPSVSYYPVEIDLPPSPTGPSCWDPSAPRYEQNIEICNPNPIACGDHLPIEIGVSPEPFRNINGVDCLIHADDSNPSSGQDLINSTTSPFQISAGDNNPLIAGSVVQPADVVTTSSSVVNLPIYDSNNPPGSPPPDPATVIGFLQVFIRYVGGGGRPHVTVLNVVGCGGASGTPVRGGAGTAVPVRLIQGN
jgi:Flp pilus assembly protein TadG